MNLFQKKMLSVTDMMAVLMVFVLISPTGLMNVISALAIVSYFIAGDYGEKWQRIKSNPAVLPSFLLFCLFAIGVLYSPATLSYSLHHLSIYRELILFPIAISMFSRGEVRSRAYYALLTAIGVAVSVSFAMRLGWLPKDERLGEEWIPFRDRISYGFYLAFAIYLMLHHAVRAETRNKKLLWLVFAGLTFFDLFYLTEGRTGYIVFIALFALLLYQHRALAKKNWLVLLLVIPALTFVVEHTSPAISSRSNDMEVAKSNPEESSIGLRLIFWQTSLRIIRDHPLIGAGTGGFAVEATSHAGDHPNLTIENPHNEYLFITSQLGVVGLLAYIWLLYTLFKVAKQLPFRYSVAAQGLVVAMAVGSLFNSTLRDEGHFFAIYAGVLFSSFGPDRASA